MKILEILNSGNIKLMMFTLAGIGVNFIMFQIAFQIKLSKTKSMSLLASFAMAIGFTILGFILYNKFIIGITFNSYLHVMLVPAAVLSFVYILYSYLTKKDDDVLVSNREERAPKLKDTPFRFKVETTSKDIVHSDPYDNFLCIAGANSGKTKSVGNQLLREYLRHHFAMFLYDAKDYDYTRTVCYILEHVITDYPYPLYYINFTDMSKTYRCNLIKPSTINENELSQLIFDMASTFGSKDAKQDGWFEGGVSILQGVALRFYLDFKRQCTIPHVMLFIQNATKDELVLFMKGNKQSELLGKMFIESMIDSPKEANGYYSGAVSVAKKVATNKEICYVFSGDDFDYNLIDPNNPKLLCVSNNNSLEDLLSPMIAMMVQLSARRFTIQNKINFSYFFDEATTARIKGYHKYVSLLREYKASFAFLTQSIANIELQYTVTERRAMLSNFGNQYYGKTTDKLTKEELISKFPKIDKLNKSQSIGKNSKGGSSRNVTSRLDEKDKYDLDFFEHLRPGEFLGTSSNSNYNNFHLQLNQFLVPDDYEVPVVRNVTKKQVDENYNSIIKKVSSII